jgi:hypothetical protein
MKRNLIILIVIAVCATGLLFVYFGQKKPKILGDQTVQNQPSSEMNSLADTISEKIQAVENLITGGNKNTDNIAGNKSGYFLHTNITSTFFWVGEKADDDNKDISNTPSAWDDFWKKHFGGTDTPKRRNGFFPADFMPLENPFYVALPYNDIDKNGKRKQSAYTTIPWAKEKNYSDSESICKNRWVKMIKNSKTVYAQWEDVGPFKENDSNYVFGTATPASKTNKNAGIDVSPAVRDYLGLKDIDKLDWQFVDEKDVPQGPWKNIVTVSQIDWK